MWTHSAANTATTKSAVIKSKGPHAGSRKCPICRRSLPVSSPPPPRLVCGPFRCQSNASPRTIWKVTHVSASIHGSGKLLFPRTEVKMLGIPHHSPPLQCVHVLLAELLSFFSSPPFSLSAGSFSPPSQMPLFSNRGNRGTLLRKQTLLCDFFFNSLCLLPNVTTFSSSGPTNTFYFNQRKCHYTEGHIQTVFRIRWEGKLYTVS